MSSYKKSLSDLYTSPRDDGSHSMYFIQLFENVPACSTKVVTRSIISACQGGIVSSWIKWAPTYTQKKTLNNVLSFVIGCKIKKTQKKDIT